MNPKQAAQLLMYNTVPTNSEAAPPVMESNSDPLIKDTCGCASYHAADARRSDGLRPERGWMPEDAPPRARFVPCPSTP